jgi:hypothetical protein
MLGFLEKQIISRQCARNARVLIGIDLKIRGQRKMASEELNQRRFSKTGINVVDYEYFPTHSTTLEQYKKAKIIPNRNYESYGKRRPDGLLVDRREKSVIFPRKSGHNEELVLG